MCVQPPSPLSTNIINTTQQEQAISLHSSLSPQHGSRRLPNLTHHHITTLDLAKMQLGQHDQAIRLSNTLGNQPLGIAVGKP
jgi:hypothetical protein